MFALLGSFLGGFLQPSDQFGVDLSLSRIRLGFRAVRPISIGPGHAGVTNMVASTAAAEIAESVFIVLTSVS